MWSTDCLLSNFFRMVSAWACVSAIALEMKSLQNIEFPNGEPKMRIPSVISRGTPLMVDFCSINQRSSLPKDVSWSLSEISSLSINLTPLTEVIPRVSFWFSIAPIGRPNFLNWFTKKVASVYLGWTKYLGLFQHLLPKGWRVRTSRLSSVINNTAMYDAACPPFFFFNFFKVKLLN